WAARAAEGGRLSPGLAELETHRRRALVGLRRGPGRADQLRRGEAVLLAQLLLDQGEARVAEGLQRLGGVRRDVLQPFVEVLLVVVVELALLTVLAGGERVDDATTRADVAHRGDDALARTHLLQERLLAEPAHVGGRRRGRERHAEAGMP